MSGDTGHVERIAILGGGMGALVTAFELTSVPNWQKQYEVTVYQQGWRLGGKGASGRNWKHRDRNEEHGLHLWFGMYENAFRVMRRCYEELGRHPDAPLATMREAFKPEEGLGVMERVGLGRDSQEGFADWVFWIAHLPPREAARPGEGQAYRPLWELLGDLLTLALNAFRTSLPGAREGSPPSQEDPWGSLARDLGLLEGALQQANVLALNGVQRVLAQLLRAHAYAQEHQSGRLIARLMGQVRSGLWSLLAGSLEGGTASRRLWVLVDLITSIIIGMVEDGVLETGWDAIDDEDLTEWLKRHGARELTCESGIVRGIYDFVFAYERGDFEHAQDTRNLAAGSGLRFITRVLFDYRGAAVWKMQAGMGETVFAPLYQVLKRRGVRFRFFHKVTALRLDTSRQAVAAIEVDLQVQTRPEAERRAAHAEWCRKREGRPLEEEPPSDGPLSGQEPGEYEPLYVVKGLPCWPSEPLYHQLENGDALEKEWATANLESWWSTWKPAGKLSLQHGRDFDRVVLGISLGALPYLCQELIQARPEWRDMARGLGTVQTQGMQLWLRPSLENLGWKGAPTVIDAYAQPMNTYCDMSQLLPRESWRRGPDTPGSLAYFCGPMRNLAFLEEAYRHPHRFRELPAKVEEDVRQGCIDWLSRYPSKLWPLGMTTNEPRELNWELLVDSRDRRGRERFRAQFWKANVDPSERYVQSLKGTTRLRLHPGDSKFHNLVLAGDWTRTGLNIGCIEAATMSGMGAARAITGDTMEIFGEEDGSGFTQALGRIHVSGEYESTLMVLSLPTDLIQSLLPPELSLEPRDELSHPLILSFTRRSQAHFSFPKALLNTTYDEVMVAVPFVTATTRPALGSFLYISEVLLNDSLVASGAGLLWGFDACRVQIDRSAGEIPLAPRVAWHVSSPGGHHQPLLTLTVQATHPLTLAGMSPQGAGVAERLEGLEEMLRRPILTRSWTGKYKSAQLEWNLDRCALRPVATNLVIHEAFARGLHQDEYPIEDIGREPHGNEPPAGGHRARPWPAAFQLKGRWHLTMARALPDEADARGAPPPFPGHEQEPDESEWHEGSLRDEEAAWGERPWSAHQAAHGERTAWPWAGPLDWAREVVTRVMGVRRPPGSASWSQGYRKRR